MMYVCGQIISVIGFFLSFYILYNTEPETETFHSSEWIVIPCDPWAQMLSGIQY